MKSRLSICTLYRDEAPYLREWIEFHRLVGVDRFFLYDNGSVDDHREMLAPYVESGLVVLHEWPESPGQLSAYRHTLNQHRDESRWVAFIDVDEFLFSPTGEPVPDVLADFEAFPGVVVNTVTFGTAGHRTKPAGLVIESYLRRGVRPDVNTWIKTIADPARVAKTTPSNHWFVYTEGFAVDENKRPLEKGSQTEVASFSRLRINHYWMKSEEEWRRKLARPMAHSGKPRRFTEPAMVRMDQEFCAVEDRTITRYLPALREALALPVT
jgi:hypothetical protein